MKVLLILATAIGVTFSATLTLDEEWTGWKLQYTKSYEDEATESVRRLVWEDNWRFVQQHNSEGHSFEVEMNEFADLTSEEFSKFYLSKINMANLTESGSEEFSFISNEPVPDEVDWRTKGVVTPVKNQGQCGSCWAFSATGSLEGQHALKTGKLVSLSEQNLIDCSKKAGNAGCSGGLMNNAFMYIKDNGGLDTEECYPYRAEDEKCRYKSSCSGATDSGHIDVLHYDEAALKTAVAKVGPISVAIDARWGSFQLYRSGVYDEKKCSSFKLDHGVLVVGYGTYEGTDYWLVKNSWGTKWGIKGYIMMSRDKHNQCGIASQASYPKVKG